MGKAEKLWERAESAAAEYFDGEKVRASGMGYHKSDVRQVEVTDKGTFTKKEGYRVEVKSTIAKAMAVKTAWFGKIAREAKDVGQIPAVYLMFADLSSFALTPLTDEDYPIKQSTPLYGLNDVTTMYTPDQLRLIYIRNGVIMIGSKVFEDAGCGKGNIYPYWKIREDV